MKDKLKTVGGLFASIGPVVFIVNFISVVLGAIGQVILHINNNSIDGALGASIGMCVSMLILVLLIMVLKRNIEIMTKEFDAKKISKSTIWNFLFCLWSFYMLFTEQMSAGFFYWSVLLITAVSVILYIWALWLNNKDEEE